MVRDVAQLVDVATREELRAWESKLAFVAAALAGAEWMAERVDSGLAGDVGAVCLEALALRQRVRDRLAELDRCAAAPTARARRLGQARERRIEEGVAG